MTKALDFRGPIILRLATFEGMRPGEILGLERGDVDFTEECLWVRRRVYKTDVDSQKSDRSTRQVALSEGTVELLKKLV